MDEQTHEDVQRLGKRELGRHAFEERMPNRIANLISNEDDSNTVSGVIPKLVNLIERDADVKVAYLCTEHAVQIHKLQDEGAHFCGYRNMQMLCFALGHSDQRVHGDVDLKQKLGIPQLQVLIEQAWDQGINSHGKAQTGGIKGTRKHIGTSEAEALLSGLGIRCSGYAFKGKHAWMELLDFVEGYFSKSLARSARHPSVHVTSKPPIFLQRPHHSMTIIGIIRLLSGKRRVLIFDPAWRPPNLAPAAAETRKSLDWKEVLALRRYSKSERYIKRFLSFEILVAGT